MSVYLSVSDSVVISPSHPTIACDVKKKGHVPWKAEIILLRPYYQQFIPQMPKLELSTICLLENGNIVKMLLSFDKLSSIKKRTPTSVFTRNVHDNHCQNTTIINKIKLYFR